MEFPHSYSAMAALVVLPPTMHGKKVVVVVMIIATTIDLTILCEMVVDDS
jgi:hypothetical protein